MSDFGQEMLDVADLFGLPPSSIEIRDVRITITLWSNLGNRKILLFRPSRYTFAPGIRGDLVLPPGVDLYFMPGATLEVPEGVTLFIHGRVQAEDGPLFCKLINYGYFGGSGNTFVYAAPMAGEVRLLSPSQRQVRLSWWGANRMSAPGEQQGNRAYLDATRAVTGAFRCASVHRFTDFDPVTRERLPKPRALPPLEVIVSGGEYQVHGPVTLDLSPDAPLKQARLIVRGESGPLGAPPVSFLRGALLGEERDLEAPIVGRPAPHLIQVGPGIDVDFEGLSFTAFGFMIRFAAPVGPTPGTGTALRRLRREEVEHMARDPFDRL